MDIWNDREMPVLTYLVERFDDVNTSTVQLEEIQEATGLSADSVARAMRALSEARGLLRPSSVAVVAGPRGLRSAIDKLLSMWRC